MTNDEFRDQAALMAMQGYIVHLGQMGVHASRDEDEVARESYSFAEALLAERTKRYGKTDDGWIKWNGGECPVDPDAVVDIEYRDGSMAKTRAGNRFWLCEGDISDIIAYRVVGGGS